MSFDMKDGLPAMSVIEGLMPAGRSTYARVAEYLTKTAFERKAHAAHEVLSEVADAHDQENLQPPLTDDLAEAVAAFKKAGAEATSQYFLGADALLQAIFQHGHRSDSD